jgi:hypothetical protein
LTQAALDHDLNPIAAAGNSAPSFDHFVGEREQRRLCCATFSADDQNTI